MPVPREPETPEGLPAPSPAFTGVRVSSLCSLLPRPLLLTGIFREILAQHFGSAQNIEHPELIERVWRPDVTTGILIEAVHRDLPDLTEKRPAILVKRNSFRNVREGIADLNQGPIADRTGRQHYTTFWVGSHTFFCIARNGGEAELLATEVYRELHHFHPVIRNTALLLTFRVSEVGEIGQLEEARENYVVPVTVAYAWQDMWTLSQEAPILRSIRLSYILGCPAAD
jgi:hypothetical protein